MLKDNFKLCRLDSVVLLAMAVSFAALIPSVAAAAETFFSKPDLGDLLDGDVKMARMGRHGPAVHMSFIAPASMAQVGQVNASAERQAVPRPEVYLSVRLPW